MKKTLFGISLTVLALTAVALVPMAETSLYAASPDGVFSDGLVAVPFCEKDVCINGTNCEETSDDLGCNVIGSGCNTYHCAGTTQK
jgi:hypothetical protein